MPPPNRKLICNRDESHTHDTTHHNEAAYPISNHSHGLFPILVANIYGTHGRTNGKTYMPDAYRQGHKKW